MSIKSISTYESIVKGSHRSKRSLLLEFGKTYPAYIVLLLAIVGSFFVYQFLENSIDSDHKLSFEKATNSLVNRIDKHNQNIMYVQNSVQNLFENTFVVKSVFELNSLNLVETYESLLGINYVYEVYKQQMPQFIHSVRSQGYYDLKIHPKADRKKYYIVEYVVPFEGNEDRSGFDYASDEIAMEYILNSAELDSTLVTPVYKFKDGARGVQVITAIFKNGESRETLDQGIEHNQGTLILEIDTDKFFKEAIGNGNASDTTVYFSVLDPESEEDLVYKTSNFEENHANPIVAKSAQIQIAGKRFDIYFATTPNFGAGFDDYFPMFAFIATLLSGFMLFGFLISVITSRERANEIAERLAAPQRRIFDTSNDIIGILDINGNWQTVNNSITPILGIDSEQIVGNNITELFKNSIDSDELKDFIRNTKEEKAFNQTALMNTNGEEKWVSWNFSISNEDKQVYAIGRDVTLEKQAEELEIIKSRHRNLAEHYAEEANISKSFLVRDVSDKLMNLISDSYSSLAKFNDDELSVSEEKEQLLVSVDENISRIYGIVESMKENTILSDEKNHYNIVKLDFIDALRQSISKASTKYKSNSVDYNVELNRLSNQNVYANKQSLIDTLSMFHKTLIMEQNNVEVNIQISKNIFENALELEILCTNNVPLSEVVTKFKSSQFDLFDVISSDEDDYIYNLALIESDFKRMNGNITIESLEKDEALFIITIPISD
jgi:PAS domain S-box-containing protein